MLSANTPRVPNRVLLICCGGVAARLALGLLGWQPLLENAAELVVPSTSWERAREGLFLGTIGLPHYAGGVFTGSPLILAAAALCAMVPAGLQAIFASVLFTAADLVSAVLIRVICAKAVTVESGNWETELEGWMDDDLKPPGSSRVRANAAGAAESKVSTTSGSAADTTASATRKTHVSPGQGEPGPEAANLPDLALAVYFLNPVMICQCAALSGDVLGRVLPIAALAAAASRRPRATAAALAGATCLWRFYAGALLLPASLMLGHRRVGNDEDRIDSPRQVRGAALSGRNVGQERPAIADRGTRRQDDADDIVGASDESRMFVSSTGEIDPRYFSVGWRNFCGLAVMFSVGCAAVLGACWRGTSRSWAFLGAAAREQLLCESLTPNAGLYWYFFAQLFPRFRGYFRVLFFSQPYVYVLPAVIRLGMFPEAVAVLMLATFGLFHPYPSLADPVLIGCLFLCFPRTSARMRFVVPVMMLALVPTLLLPVMRHLWLQAGTGNANFYYFQTVILNVMISMFVLQFAAALVKRRKALAVAFVKRRKAERAKGSAAEETPGEYT